jgi:hypothetical protein
LGTGIRDLLCQAKKTGLKNHDFVEEGEFGIIVFKEIYTRHGFFH